MKKKPVFRASEHVTEENLKACGYKKAKYTQSPRYFLSDDYKVDVDYSREQWRLTCGLFDPNSSLIQRVYTMGDLEQCLLFLGEEPKFTIQKESLSKYTIQTHTSEFLITEQEDGSIKLFKTNGNDSNITVKPSSSNAVVIA